MFVGMEKLRQITRFIFTHDLTHVNSKSNERKPQSTSASCSVKIKTHSHTLSSSQKSKLSSFLPSATSCCTFR